MDSRKGCVWAESVGRVPKTGRANDGNTEAYIRGRRAYARVHKHMLTSYMIDLAYMVDAWLSHVTHEVYERSED